MGLTFGGGAAECHLPPPDRPARPESNR